MKRFGACLGASLTLTAVLAVTGAADVNTPSQRVITIKTPAIETIPHAAIPPMTRIPESHLVAAFLVKQNGQTVFIDTHGMVIGHMAPGTQSVTWDGNRSPFSQIAPTITAPVVPHYLPLPKQK